MDPDLRKALLNLADQAMDLCNEILSFVQEADACEEGKREEDGVA